MNTLNTDSLVATLQGLPHLTVAQTEELNIILTQFERYIRTAFGSVSREKRGKELSEPLEAALKTAVVMLESIDVGDTGLDDAIARELRKTYERYLGTFQV